MNGATGWTDPDGAVHLHGSPVWVFDGSFRRPPSDRPRVKLGDPAQKFLLSNNRPVSRLDVNSWRYRQFTAPRGGGRGQL